MKKVDYKKEYYRISNLPCVNDGQVDGRWYDLELSEGIDLFLEIEEAQEKGGSEAVADIIGCDAENVPEEFGKLKYDIICAYCEKEQEISENNSYKVYNGNGYDSPSYEWVTYSCTDDDVFYNL